MITVHLLQEALRVGAQANHETVSIPGFTVYFHPLRAGRHFSYAIPQPGPLEDVAGSVRRLSSEFERRSRSLRIEFIEEACEPDLPARLLAAELQETERLPVMVCTPASLQQPPPVPGMEIARLSPASSIEEALEFRNTQHFGFNPQAGLPVAVEDATETLSRAAEEGVYLARLDGQPAAAAMFQKPVLGLSEVAGIATLEAFRGRGIASALTAAVTRGAFEAGAEAAFLTASDLRAAGIYLRVGYSRWGSALVYER